MPSELERLPQRLLDIVENADAALAFIRGVSRDEFLSNRMINYAAVRALEIVSEAARHIPDSIAQAYPHIPWRKVRDAGNVFRHVYREVDLDIVWTTITEALRPLRDLAAAELEKMGHKL